MAGSRSLAGLAGLLLCAASSAQQPASKLEYAEGQLLVLVAPDYPPESVKNRETGSVVVEGRVRVNGTLENPALAVTPPNPALEAAVKAVVGYWRLQPRVDSECKFQETPTRVTIWFDIDAGQPKVSFSRALPKAPDAAFVEELQKTYPLLSKVVPVYPRRLLRNRNTPDFVAQVAYVRVLPDGKVRSVAVAPKRYHGDFEDEIVHSLLQWRYAPSEKGFCAEVPINFRIN